MLNVWYLIALEIFIIILYEMISKVPGSLKNYRHSPAKGVFDAL